MFYYLIYILYITSIISYTKGLDNNQVSRSKLAYNGKEVITVHGSGKKVFGGGGCKYKPEYWNGNIRTGGLDWTIWKGGKDRCINKGCAQQFGFNEGMDQCCAERFIGYNPYDSLGFENVITVRCIGKSPWRYYEESIDLQVGECKEMRGKKFCAKVASPSSKAYMHDYILDSQGFVEVLDIPNYMYHLSEDSAFKKSDINHKMVIKDLPQVALYVYHVDSWFDKLLTGVLIGVKDIGGGLISNMINYESEIKNLYSRHYIPSAVYPTSSQSIQQICSNRCIEGKDYLQSIKLEQCKEKAEKVFSLKLNNCDEIEEERERVCERYQKHCLQEQNEDSINDGYSASVCETMYDNCINRDKYNTCLQALNEEYHEIYDKCKDKVDDFLIDYISSCQDKQYTNSYHGNFTESLFCRNGLGVDAGYDSRKLGITGSSNIFQDAMALFGLSDHQKGAVAHLGAVPIALGGGYKSMYFYDHSIGSRMNYNIFPICTDSIKQNCYRSALENTFFNNVVRIMDWKPLYVCSYINSNGCINDYNGFLSNAYDIHYKFNDLVEICKEGQIGDCLNIPVKATSLKKAVPIYGRRDAEGIQQIKGYEEGAEVIGVNLGEYQDIKLVNIENKMYIAENKQNINGNLIQVAIFYDDPKKIKVKVDGNFIGQVERAKLTNKVFIKSYSADKVVLSIDGYKDININYNVDGQKVEREVDILGVKYDLEYADKLGRSSIDLYSSLLPTCKNIGDNNSLLFTCGKYDKNENKFINNKLNKNQNAYFIEGLEYIDGKYDRGAQYICLSSDETDVEELYVSNMRGEVVFPEKYSGVIYDSFDISEMQDICLSAVRNSQFYNTNDQFIKFMKSDYYIDGLIKQFNSINYATAKLSMPFFEVKVSERFSIGCVIDSIKNSISPIIDNNKYMVKLKNSLHRGQCLKLPDLILKKHIKDHAIWGDVKLGGIAKGVCESGYKPINNTSLSRLCVMSYKNELILQPGVFGCKLIE